MKIGTAIAHDGLKLVVDASSLRSISATGNNAYNTSPSLLKNFIDPSITLTSNNGIRVNNVDYYTAFSISYPESSYGGSAASRDGITPGYNVTSGTKVYDSSRALNFWVWNNDTNSWVSDSYFNGLRINGHCYDSYTGYGSWASEVAQFVKDYHKIRTTFPNCTYIVAGSHRDSGYTTDKINTLLDLGAPSNVGTLLADGDPIYVLVGEPGLGAGNAYGWAFENYTTDPTKVAHLVFPLPIKGNKNASFLFDGVNDYISISQDVFETNSEYTLSAWLRPNGSSWGDNAIPLYNTYRGNGSAGFWHHFGHDNVLRWRHGGASYTYADLSGIGLVANTWQMTTITWDRTTLRLYKNGVQTNSTTSPSDFNKGTQGARIGMLNYRSTANDYNWNGDIAHHLVYNKALTSTEVMNNFIATKERFGL